MKRFRRIMLFALGFALVPAIFFSLHGPTAKAQSISGGTTVNSQVELICVAFYSGASNCGEWESVDALGNGTPYFGPPANMTLIVTDLECVTVVGGPNQNGTCGLNNPYFGGPLVEAGALSGAHSVAVIGLHLTTGVGFAIEPPILVMNGTPQSATIQGYLISMR
jgi:hypothetical protein